VAEATPAVTPAREKTPSADAANMGTQQNYSVDNPALYAGPVVYQPFFSADGRPYTFQQYSSAFFPAGYYNNTSATPITVQRYLPAVRATVPNPTVVPNAFEKKVLQRATTPPPPR
jgi:hypothetical protein